tara:strand:- start:155 stop:631 length:477 start_codon:yes stop_codon:yes gene_type:complete
MSFYDCEATNIDGTTVRLEELRGKTLLIVNVASACGLTPQYEELEALYKKYENKGLEVLGFPCNQFGDQEPGTEADIKAFCNQKYGITFKMFTKIDVNGPDTHPIYKHLKSKIQGPEGSEDIEWNFAKFLVDKSGNVVGRFHPKTKPEELNEKISALL